MTQTSHIEGLPDLPYLASRESYVMHEVVSYARAHGLACYEAGRASHAAPIPSVDAVVGEPVAISEREIAEALRRHGLSLVKTEVGYEVESLGPFVAEIDYTPGNWFMAKSVDDMRAFFLSRLPAIREAAQGCGYAIGLHGSERRDFDLIAVPWRDGCDSPDALARALAIAACGLTRQGAYDWETKPLGRIAVSIPICWCEKWADDMAGAGHIDLSVMAPNSAQIARLTIDRDDAIADTKEIRARWNDAENEFALAASVASRAQTEPVAAKVTEISNALAKTQWASEQQRSDWIAYAMSLVRELTAIAPVARAEAPKAVPQAVVGEASDSMPTCTYKCEAYPECSCAPDYLQDAIGALNHVLDCLLRDSPDEIQSARLESANAGLYSAALTPSPAPSAVPQDADALREARIALLETALTEVLEFQSAKEGPHIFDWGRWRRIRDNTPPFQRAALAQHQAPQQGEQQ